MRRRGPRAAAVILGLAACRPDALPEPARADDGAAGETGDFELPGAPLPVSVGGCRTVLRGPVCVPPSDGPLVLWVEAPPDATLAVPGLVAPPVVVAGGLRAEVRVPPDMTALPVTVRGPSTSVRVGRLTLGPPDAGGPGAAHAARAVQAGKEARRAGRPDEALIRLDEARLAAETAGALSDAVTASVVAGFIHFQARRIDAQVALLEGLPPLADPARPETWYPEGEAHRRYHLALAARERGDVRGALAGLADAAMLADRFGGSLSRDVAQETAVTWLRIGRLDDAIAAFDGLAHRLPPDALCEWPYLHTNRGWAHLQRVLRRSDGAGPAGPAGPNDLYTAAERAARDFAEARLAWSRGCDDWPGFLPNLALNEALLALTRGDDAAARRALDSLPAGPLTAAPDLEVWRLDLEARLALDEGRRGPAKAALDRLAALAAAASLPEMAWRAQLGRARLAELSGRLDAAQVALQAAERLPAEESRGIPVDEGRLRFLGDREESARRLVDVLVRRGRLDEALAAARRARRRGIVALTGAGRAETLPPARRAAWASAWEAVARTRAALDADRADDWKRTDAALAAATRRREGLLRSHRVARGALFDLLGGPADDAPLPPLPRDGVTLAWFPGTTGWHAFAALPGPPAEPSGGPGIRHARLEGTVPAEPEAARAWAFAPFESLLRETPSVPVRLLPYGALRDLDLHAAAVDGRPLAAQRAVVYGLDLPVPADPAPPVSNAAAVRALVVADPQGNLAGSAEEGRAVAMALGRRSERGVQLLVDREATRDAVAAALDAADLFHFAGHGLFAGREGWESALLLADGGRLTTGDILALPRPPAVAVLSGCETGRASAGTESPLESLGLAQAFVIAGSRTAVAAARRVPDALTRALFTELYAHWTPPAPVEGPLGAATAALAAAHPGADVAAFRVFVP